MAGCWCVRCGCRLLATLQLQPALRSRLTDAAKGRRRTREAAARRGGGEGEEGSKGERSRRAMSRREGSGAVAADSKLRAAFSSPMFDPAEPHTI